MHHDAQGSVRGVTSSAGVKVEQTIYNPYGNCDDVQLTWRSADPAPQNRPFAQASCAASCAGPPPSWSLKV